MRCCGFTGRCAGRDSSTAEMVFLAGLLWGLGFYFVTPYQVGLLAEIDRTGRLEHRLS